MMDIEDVKILLAGVDHQVTDELRRRVRTLSPDQVAEILISLRDMQGQIGWLARQNRALAAASRDRLQPSFAWSPADGTTFGYKPKPTTIAVIVTTHGDAYTKWLPVALQSLRGQTRPPDEIVVVHDSPRQSKAVSRICRQHGVPLFRQNFGSAVAARNFGAAQTHSAWLSWLDADDYLEADYCRKFERLSHDERVSGWDPIIQCFGARTDRIKTPASLERYERVPFGSLCGFFRREVWEHVGGLDEWPCLQDWAWFLKLVEAGYKVRPFDGVRLYRHHDEGGIVSRTAEDRQKVAHEIMMRYLRVAQLGLLVERNMHCFDEWAGAILNQDYDLRMVHPVWFFDGEESESTRRVRKWLEKKGAAFGGFTFIVSGRPALDDAERRSRRFYTDAKLPLEAVRKGLFRRIAMRVCGNYALLREMLNGPLVWKVESDVICPPHCLRELTRTLSDDPEALAAAAVVRMPVKGRVMAGNFLRLDPMGPACGISLNGPEVERVGWAADGCKLVRRGLIFSDEIAVRPTREGHNWWCADVTEGRDVISLGKKTLITRRVICKHYLDQDTWISGESAPAEENAHAV